MAFARVGAAAIQTGRMPRVCMCCGNRADHLAMHRFYYDPVWLMVLSLVLPKFSRYLSGYDAVEMSVPLCGGHQHRFRLMSVLGYSLVGVALLFVPLMIYFTYTKQAAAQGWMAVILIVIAVGLLSAMLALRLLSPRLVEVRGDYLGFTGVSNEFAGAFGGGSASSGGIGKKELLIIGGVCGVGLLLLIGVGVATYITNMWQKHQWQQQVEAHSAQAKAEHFRIVAEHRAHAESGTSEPFVPSTHPKTPAPMAHPSPAEMEAEGRRIAAMSPEERREFYQKKAQSEFHSPSTAITGNSTASSAPPPESQNNAPVASKSPAATSNLPATVATGPKARRGEPRQPVAAFQGKAKVLVPPPRGVILMTATRLPVGEEVWSVWGSQWYPATVVETTASGVKVHYAGYDDNFDEVQEWDRVAVDVTIMAELNAAESASGSPSLPFAPPTAGSTPAAESAVRQWVDVTGKFKIEGKLGKFEQNNVTIIKTDGKEITVPLEKLSPRDQMHVLKQQ